MQCPLPTHEQLSTLLCAKAHWGEHLSVICSSSDAYLPGYYGLYNSLMMNGFQGKFIFFPVNDLASEQVCLKENTLRSALHADIKDSHHHVWLKRIYCLLDLPDGDYLYSDVDIIFERPCGWLTSMIDQGLIVCAQPDFYRANNDVLEAFRAAQLGVDLPMSVSLRYYINAGLMLFRYPRDRDFIKGFIEATLEAANNPNINNVHTLFPLLEQDVLNLFYQKAMHEGKKILMINPDVWEFGGNGSRFGPSYWMRPFPWTRQASHIANRTYLIHGAAIRRPWLWMMQDGLKAHIYRTGIGPWVRRKFKRNLTPYERAWVHYACAEDRPIPFSAWAEGWPKLKKCLNNPLWRAAFE